MTRAEAIAIASRHNMAGEHRLVDCLVALGILQLEAETDIVDSRVYKKLCESVGHMEFDKRNCLDIVRTLDRAGLQIVEKTA